jgi:Cu/Ag efflux protein CusF
MLTWNTLCVVSLLVLTGCAAAYTPPPLTPAHPAHPEAIAAPEPPPSTTLAYGPSDVPSRQPIYAMAQGGKEDMHPSTQESQQTVVGEGQVIAVVPSSHQVVVDHQEIKGFMDAMTMGYRVNPPSVLEGLNAGDKIRFTLDTQQKAIVKIEKMTE